MIWRRSRVPGRHRDGLAVSSLPARTRRPWDGHARAEAERLSRAWSGWTVLYGPGSRRFYAVASWPAPEPVVLDDRTPDGLEARMRETEAAMVTRYGAPAASGGLRTP
ncbi:hypothetical protein AB0395_29485 [Streptosporangium sp. NPDC051023]|uniref:hypothetical protein n=1 Tax=Streptosporangium sp. NPDC051023 TaxID=3155410 RepID=UPI00344DEC03